MTKVRQLPKTVTLPNGDVVINPSVEQAREAGYELYTPEELQQLEEQYLQWQQERQQAELERQQMIEALRLQYAQATLAICSLGGLDPVTKFEDASPIQAVYEGIMAQIPGEGDPTVVLGLLAQASQVQAHAQTIQLCITELRRHDGDDAWERIPENSNE